MKYTEQSAFNKVWRGMKKQGWKRSITADTSIFGSPCRLRGDEGRKCAIGQLIPDKAYNRGMEDIGILNLMEDVKGIRNLGYSFLRDLQRAHDNADDSAVSLNLRQVAGNYKLVVPE